MYKIEKWTNYLFNNETAQRVGHKYNGSILFLLINLVRKWFSFREISINANNAPSPLVNQAAEKACAEISDRRNIVAESCIGVISVGHYSRSGDVQRKEVFEPATACNGPSLNAVAVETMNCDDTVQSLVTIIHQKVGNGAEIDGSGDGGVLTRQESRYCWVGTQVLHLDQDAISANPYYRRSDLI